MVMGTATAALTQGQVVLVTNKILVAKPLTPRPGISRKSTGQHNFSTVGWSGTLELTFTWCTRSGSLTRPEERSPDALTPKPDVCSNGRERYLAVRSSRCKKYLRRVRKERDRGQSKHAEVDKAAGALSPVILATAES